MNSIETADAIIIGGGVIGVSLAYYLAQRQFGRITVLERETLGSGSTGRSVASIDLYSAQAAAIELQVRAYQIFAHFEELLGSDCGLVTTGLAVLAGAEHAAALQRSVRVTQAAGVNIQLLTPEGFAALEPAATIDGLAAIGYIPAAGYADPMLTTNAFAIAARRSNVIIQQGRPVIGLNSHIGRIAGVETASGSIAAPVVVLAAGPWNGPLLKKFGYNDLGLQACLHPVVSLHQPAAFGSPGLSLLDYPNGIYARPESGGLTLAGSLEATVGYDPVDPDATYGAVTPDYSFWTAERLVQRYPAMETSELRGGWAGLVTTSPDWQPLLGAVPEVPGLYIAAGFSAQGFKISPAVGDLLAGLIAGEAEAARRLAPFRPTRFAEGQPFPLNETGALG
jgi:sarcosine oxidase subunit beta